MKRLLTINSFILSGLIYLILIIFIVRLNDGFYSEVMTYLLLYGTLSYLVITLLIYLVKNAPQKYYYAIAPVFIVIIVLFIWQGFDLAPSIEKNNIEYSYKSKYNDYILYERDFDTCDEAIETLSDGRSAIYFNCIKSHNYLISYDDEVFELEEGLENNKITYEEIYLLFNGEIGYYIVPIAIAEDYLNTAQHCYNTYGKEGFMPDGECETIEEIREKTYEYNDFTDNYIIKFGYDENLNKVYLKEYKDLSNYNVFNLQLNETFDIDKIKTLSLSDLN